MRLSLFSIFLYLTFTSTAQYTVSGYVSDAASGETLIGANVVLASDESVGVSSNTYGFLQKKTKPIKTWKAQKWEL